MASPICAMGWGRDGVRESGFHRYLFESGESAENFDENLKRLACSFREVLFEVIREDGLKDVNLFRKGRFAPSMGAGT